MSFMNMPFKIVTCLLTVSSTILVSGCASVKKSWHKPDMTQDSWAIDSVSCHSRALKHAEENLEHLSAVSNSGVDNVRSYKALMDHHGAQKNLKTIYRRCLQNKGYQLITPKAKSGQQA